MTKQSRSTARAGRTSPNRVTSIASDYLPTGSLVQLGNLKEQIARVIRTEILTGRMRPGTTYKMGELAARFGASRTPMREAILELEAKGLVEITRGVGFRVSAPSEQERRDVLQVREMLEVPATASLAGRLDAEQLRVARALMEESRIAAVDNDLVAYLERDKAFHLYLIAQTGNRRLVDIVSDLRDAQRVPGLSQLASDRNLLPRHTEHVAIIDAIEAGDAERVETAVRQHLSLSRLAWSTSLDEDQPPDGSAATPATGKASPAS